MRRIALAAAGMISLGCAGCMTMGPSVVPAVTGGGFTYTAGRASQDFAYPAPPLQTAVTSALEDLRIHSVNLATEGSSLIYRGTTPDGRTASVTIRPNQGTSRVSVRVGWFGDEPFSRALMDRIGIRLGTLPPQAIPVDPPSEPGSNPYFSREAIPDSVMLRDQADAIYRDRPVP